MTSGDPIDVVQTVGELDCVVVALRDFLHRSGAVRAIAALDHAHAIVDCPRFAPVEIERDGKIVAVPHSVALDAEPPDLPAFAQPFPSKPTPFDLQGFKEADLIDFTPELRAEAQGLLKKFRLSPNLYTPPSLFNAADGTTGVKTVVTGTYSAGESNLEAGWTQTAATCVRGTDPTTFPPSNAPTREQAE